MSSSSVALNSGKQPQSEGAPKRKAGLEPGEVMERMVAFRSRKRLKFEETPKCEAGLEPGEFMEDGIVFFRSSSKPQYCSLEPWYHEKVIHTRIKRHAAPATKEALPSGVLPGRSEVEVEHDCAGGVLNGQDGSESKNREGPFTRFWRTWWK